MPNQETPAERYRRLAQECLEVATTFPPGDQRDAVIHMAQVWQRLADQRADATAALPPPIEAEQPAVQQQQQVQPKDEENKC